MSYGRRRSDRPEMPVRSNEYRPGGMIGLLPLMGMAISLLTAVFITRGMVFWREYIWPYGAIVLGLLTVVGVLWVKSMVRWVRWSGVGLEVANYLGEPTLYRWTEIAEVHWRPKGVLAEERFGGVRITTTQGKVIEIPWRDSGHGRLVTVLQTHVPKEAQRGTIELEE